MKTSKTQRKRLHSALCDAKRRHKEAYYMWSYHKSVFDRSNKTIKDLHFSENMEPSEFEKTKQNLKILAYVLECGENLRAANERRKRLFAEYQVALKAYQEAIQPI